MADRSLISQIYSSFAMLSFYVMKNLSGTTYFKMIFGSSLVLSSVIFIVFLIENRPDLAADLDMDPAIKYQVKFPTNLPEVKEIVNVLSQYKKEHINYVILLFSSAYVFKQSFGIPGSFLLNITAGALFGVPHAFLLVSILTGIGATCCYLMSRYFGRELVETIFPRRIGQLRNMIEANQDGLFFYLMFLRLFPMTPNWLLNITSPIINVPLHYFFFSVLFGLMPYNYISVQTGNILYELSSLDSVFTPSIIVKMVLAAMAALLPGILIKYTKYRQSNLLLDDTVASQHDETKID